jgi:uncharacterized membrane protein YhaH (DUF805 family)
LADIPASNVDKIATIRDVLGIEQGGMCMIRVLFGELQTGRLKRLPYLGYSVLLSVLMIVAGMALAYVAGIGEMLLAGDFEAAQAHMSENFSIVAVLLFIAVSLLFLFAGINIMAKRFRDIGLPGWWMVLAVIVVTGLVSVLVSDEASNILQTVIWIVLLLIPGDSVGSPTDLATSEKH